MFVNADSVEKQRIFDDHPGKGGTAVNALSRIMEYMRSHGAAYTAHRLGQIGRQRVFGAYDRRRARELTPPEELEVQRRNPPECGLISVAVPVYNTDPRMLREMLDSLSAQTLENFEAVLYDGASTRADTRAVLDEIQDPRFRVIHAEENRGISGNTNAAVELAKGEFVALVDHDDLLAPDALWRAAKIIARDNPDIVYTDEDRIMENSRHYMDPHYKPDWNPETLVSDNYICHLAVIRKTLLQDVGGLRTGFDGSQDHDLFLRLGEKTDKIAHIPKVLYSWREVKSSRSHLDLQTCLESGCRAAEEHEARMGRRVSAVPVNKVIRLWYDVDPETRVEALIHGESEEECRACLQELQERTTWRNLSAALLVTDAENRFAALNEAAAGSEADVLLVLEAGVYGMNRHFIRELLMYAQMDGVAGVTPVLTDSRGRITHGGFAVGLDAAAACLHEGLRAAAGGTYDIMNKVHNVSAVSPCCMMVRRDAWADFDPVFRTGLAGADLGLAQRKAGRRFVVTPHAAAVREKDLLLLSGDVRDERDLRRFREKWGTEIHDPCYSPNFDRKKANYKY